ncbi:MFS transporter [Methylovirgula sp. HY1]|uniref:MFS transporter n=1 Tax=Methylovirgula sp. HY1 TaxID=2822761 RepID=UPI0021025B04|nr:MFS transporter [Methylovirgula sp. HY1]
MKRLSVGGGFRAAFVVAWAFCLVFYFTQYAVRSAPSVMLPELRTAYGLTTVGLSSLIGIYYYTYSTFAIVAGASLDRWGAKYAIPTGVFFLAIGIVMFGLGISWVATLGRLLQGAGAAFAFVGAVYLATHGFPARYLATAIGFTQMIGMLGGSAGQFAVGPIVHGVVSWQQFWIYSGIFTFVVAIAIFAVTPKQDIEEHTNTPVWQMFEPYKTVLTNPQSYLCGICAGLLFLPTTVGGMIWGVSFLHQGWDISTSQAVTRASMVPLGWVIGCPLLGYISDHIGRRKPVLFGGMVLMLLCTLALIYLHPNTFPPYVLGLLLGIGSGAAMIPYSMIKEINPDRVKGSATGAINFIVFVMSAFAAPFFGMLLQKLAGGGALTLRVFDKGGTVFIAAIVLAAIVALFLKETGSAANNAAH